MRLIRSRNGSRLNRVSDSRLVIPQASGRYWTFQP
jgi:hypothetical protein